MKKIFLKKIATLLILLSVLAETSVEDRKRSFDSAAASRGDTGPNAFYQVLEE